MRPTRLIIHCRQWLFTIITFSFDFCWIFFLCLLFFRIDVNLLSSPGVGFSIEIQHVIVLRKSHKTIYAAQHSVPSAALGIKLVLASA